MTSSWYKDIQTEEPVDQGDLILQCPVISWRSDANNLPADATLTLGTEEATRLFESKVMDVVVLTQTCDLAQSKALRVVLCRFYRMSDYKKMFKNRFDDYRDTSHLSGKKLEDRLAKLQKHWQTYCGAVKNGSTPNYCIIEAVESDSHGSEQLVVDFAEIYSVPTKWLQSTIREKALPRVKLLPPYRDYVAHSFGRMYSRVGLDPDLKNDWQTF